ncbi:MAG: TraR/DksA C4-type zinc finger protein [Burkholderiaceae bacterium]|nr:TraR/DksA C4-type zinc finger protein [Burkholderiaceae bacterium]
MSYFLSPGQRALLQQLLQMRQHELDRRVALHGASRSERASEVLQQDADDAPQRDADREIDLARADRDLQELGAVSDALARVHDAKFGLCLDCGEAIAFDRLKLEPWALRCVACEAARERKSGELTPRSTI